MALKKKKKPLPKSERKVQQQYTAKGKYANKAVKQLIETEFND